MQPQSKLIQSSTLILNKKIFQLHGLAVPPEAQSLLALLIPLSTFSQMSANLTCWTPLSQQQ
jgi:hypothetical protein